MVAMLVQPFACCPSMQTPTTPNLRRRGLLLALAGLAGQAGVVLFAALSFALGLAVHAAFALRRGAARGNRR